MPDPRSSATASLRTADATGPPLGPIAATCVGIAIYLVLFYRTNPRRGLILRLLLIPEELASSWVDGDWSRFGILDHFPVLAGGALICLVSGLTGWLLLSLLGAAERLDRTEQLVVSVAAGLNVWSLAALGLGLAGLLHHDWLFASLAVGVSALALGRLAALCRGDRLATAPSDRAPAFLRSWLPPRGTWLPLGMCLPLLAVILLGSTLPATHFDVREYHLQVPKEWFQLGRVTFLPHNVYGNMPLGAEMHALLGMIMAFGKDDWWWGALIGKTVIGSFAPLAAAEIYVIGRRFVGSAAGAWGAFAFLSCPWIAHVSMTGLIDGAVACYVVTAVGVALHVVPWWDEPGNRDRCGNGALLAVSGFLAGGAVACKYPPLLFLVVPLGLLILFLPQGKIHGRAAVIFALGVAAGCGLWFAKNAVLAGNPTYPLLHSVFPGESWTDEQNARWTQAHGPPRDANGRRFSAAQAWDSAQLLFVSSDHHGPWLVPLAIAALWSWTRRSARRLIGLLYGLVAVAVVLWWLVTHRVDRFLVPMLPLVAVGAGIGATWSDSAAWRRFVVLFSIYGALASFAQISSPYGADNRFLIALSDLRTDLPRPGPHPFTRMNDGHRWLNENVPPGKKVLLVGEAQVFDLEMPILYNTCFDDCVLESLLAHRSREERRKILNEQNVSHVFVSWYELQRYRSPGNYGYSDYPTRELFDRELVREQRLLRPLRVGAGRDVYEIFAVVAESETTEQEPNAVVAP